MSVPFLTATHDEPCLSTRGPLLLNLYTAAAVAGILALGYGVTSTVALLGTALGGASVRLLLAQLRLTLDGASLRYGFHGRHVVPLADCDGFTFRQLRSGGAPRVVQLVMRDGSVRTLWWLSFRRTTMASLSGAELYSRTEFAFVYELRSFAHAAGLSCEPFEHAETCWYAG